MLQTIIYLDESGDLGWNFAKEYRKGGSSRHLTIAALIVPLEKQHLIVRRIRKLYFSHNWDTKKEKKWAHMNGKERCSFANSALKIVNSNQDIQYTSITAYKPNVKEHIRNDANKLYNYMVRLLLVPIMKKFQQVIFVPDQRSIKVKSGNSLSDYLTTTLWFEHNATTKIISRPQNSSSLMQLQFADMLAGTIQNHFEDGSSEPFKILENNFRVKKLYH